MSFLAGPGAFGDRLASPGSYILVQAQRSGTLELTVSATQPDGSVDAKVQLQRILTGDETADARHSAASAAQPLRASASSGLEILAHVAHRGDIRSKPGDWVCGPDLPMPIEGFAIDWPDKPRGVELGYSVNFGQSQQQRSRESREMKAGQFVGTRGKFTPITGLTLDLRGPQSVGYELRASALFLGAHVVSKQALNASFSGPTGCEPLLGLRLSVAAPEARTNPVNVRPARTVAMRQVGRIRVYRPELTSAHQRKLSPSFD
jgi:hypothetical protein